MRLRGDTAPVKPYGGLRRVLLIRPLPVGIDGATCSVQGGTSYMAADPVFFVILRMRDIASGP